MTIIGDRFEILSEIGRGSQAVTYRAIDHETRDEVALKELDFRRVEDWKSQELFEREGQTLRGLQHEAIPRYVAAFAVESEDSIRLFLAQEFVDGPTLAEELASGRRWTEAEAIEDARRLLDALAYLHERMPPVIHRDIKPSNLIRRPDGGIAIVDFGAAQNALPRTVGGSTVIGTPGYMPMEQLMGRAVPATDLYAFGATIIHLLTAVEPAALPVERNRLVFADKVRCGATLQRVLERLTQPSVEDRYPDAAAVLRDLNTSLVADTLPTTGGPKPIPSDELALTGEGSSSIERVVFENRTLSFPRWADVRPYEGGTFVIAFETRDSDEQELRIEVHDGPDDVTMLAWIDETNRHVGRSSMLQMNLAAAVALVALCWVVAPSLVPLAIVGAMSILFIKIAADERHEDDEPDVRLRIGHEDIEMVRAGEFRMRTPTRSANWLVDGTGLRLRTDREVPVIELSQHYGYQCEWLERHLSSRAAEISASRLLGSAGASAEEREEFWKEEPVEAASK